ncbi:uncharacterized protein LOC136757126 [Amia ocellicauda]|uniref:uncharacterized protein LOC136757126 n=1 Tax=Amia ocellicauda TaxID=2972642 RepID=UPI003464D571
MISLVWVSIPVLFGHMIFAFPTVSPAVQHDENGCILCEPGYYRSSCTQCSRCGADSYTESVNSEPRCHSCNRDCREVFNMEVVQNCSKVRPLLCRCKPGFHCMNNSSHGDCDQCTKNINAECGAGTFLNQTSGNCDPHTNCESVGQTVRVPGNATVDTQCMDRQKDPDKQNFSLVYVSLILVLLGILGIFILFKNCSDSLCIKKVAKLCVPDNQKVNTGIAVLPYWQPGHQLLSSREPQIAESYTNHSPERSLETDCPQTRSPVGDWWRGANQSAERSSQPISRSSEDTKCSGNLGPFHIYSPGTVFVGLLNQLSSPPPPLFPQPFDPEREGGREGARESEREGGEAVRLSEEERGAGRERESDSARPSQEQGKESHLSREEEKEE